MITFKQKGNFKKTLSFLNQDPLEKEKTILAKYGEKGVAALQNATPVETGLTASSWYYQIRIKDNRSLALEFCNSNIQNGVPIAILLQYGHATKSGTWVEGVDYINPAVAPIFDKIADEIWKEVTK